LAASLKTAYFLKLTKHKTMTQNTQNKMAEILAAAKAKAAQKTAAKPCEVHPEPIKEVSINEPLPELSTMTFADLLSDSPAIDTNYTSNTTKQPETRPQPAKNDNLQYIDYSDKAFAIIGNTKVIKDQLKQLGGRFNPFLKCGAGWIFSKAKLQTVKNYLPI
jgi:hypothetical protein